MLLTPLLGTLLVVASAQAAPLQALLAGPESPGAGNTVYAAGNNVRVRAEPNTESPVVHVVALGDALTVGQAAPMSDTVADRRSVWLPVSQGKKTGWVWAGAVTQARFAADLDADGEEEILTVAYNSAGEVVVRSREPGVVGDAAIGFVNLGTFQDINGLQGITRAELLGADTAGIPLLRVQVEAGEYCGSGSHYRYLSLRSDAPKVPSTLALALSHNGDGGDSPVWWSTEVRFEPKARAVVVKAESGEDDQTHESKTTRYTLKEGVFVASAAP